MSPKYDPAVAMNFSWLECGRLAGCGRGSLHFLDFLQSQGIRALVRLLPDDEFTGSADIQAHGFEECYEPVADFTAPCQHQIDRVVSFIHAAIDRGKPVAVMCGAGMGRTGTILACYLVSLGIPAEDAIRQLIEKRPCSREILNVPGQREAVFEFERRRGDRSTTRRSQDA